MFAVGLRTWVHLLPRLLAFLIKATFYQHLPLNYWLLSGDHPNLSLVTWWSMRIKQDHLLLIPSPPPSLCLKPSLSIYYRPRTLLGAMDPEMRRISFVHLSSSHSGGVFIKSNQVKLKWLREGALHSNMPKSQVYLLLAGQRWVSLFTISPFTHLGSLPVTHSEVISITEGTHEEPRNVQQCKRSVYLRNIY